MDNVKFLGIAEVDLSISFIQQLTSEVSRQLYQGRGQVNISSHIGIVSEHSGDKSALGKNVRQVLNEKYSEIQNSVLNQKQRLQKIEQEIIVMVPFKTDHLNGPWIITISTIKVIT